MSEPLVSIIVPCRNEVRHIETFFACLFRQEPVDGGLEIIIADGLSNDGTRERLSRFAMNYPELRVIDNPGGIVSTGLNRAIAAARGEIIVRMDVHTEYATDYISRCVTTLRTTGADNVGGPWQAKGKTYTQNAIATAFQSGFSSGGAASHRVDYDGPVDSVYLGCWRKETLVKLGGFDEELVRNQDDELNLRLTRSGGVIWQDRTIRSCYYPRSSVLALFRQYAQYGYWKVRVIQKHRLPASIRHLIPGAFVGGFITLGVIAPFHRVALLSWLTLSVTYLIALLLATAYTCLRPGRWQFTPIMPVIFAMFHIGYGYGFLRGLFDFAVRGRRSPLRFSSLTR